MTRKNAATAQQAAALAAEARAASDAGTGAVARMDAAVNDIQRSATETTKILKTIDEIAFQTNLLALNAAVEAARAGEAGKGFAVVAEEVRNLALRSAEAARNTATLIEGSVTAARHGATIGGEVAKSLAAIGASVAQVNGLVNEMSGATQEQSQSITQINSAMGQMDQVTQSAAASAEEGAAAAEELSSQAEQLRSAVRDLTRLIGVTEPAAAATHSHRPSTPAPPMKPTLKPYPARRPAPAGFDEFSDNQRLAA
jgi:methyl-accepting chemotaxis protein